MPKAKPLVGLNAEYRGAREKCPAYMAVSAGYFDCIQKAGGIPVVVPPTRDDDDIDCVLERLDAFVLVGGPDLDPRRDGFMLHPTVKPMDPRREDFDRRLVRRICARRLPVFGIGAGMQLLNVTMGGNLYLHVPEDMPQALPHRDSQDPAHRHGLEVEFGSLMERVYGDGEIRVNSMHHMAVDELAPDFAATARCPDGIVEAIECRDKDWLAIGTQFHPEAHSASALDQRVFEEFLAGVFGEVAAVRMVA